MCLNTPRILTTLMLLFVVIFSNSAYSSTTTQELNCEGSVQQQANDTAIESCLKQAQTLQSQRKNSELLLVYLALAKLYANQGDGNRSQYYLNETRNNEAFEKSITARYQWNRQVGLNHLHLNAYSRAFEYLNKAYFLADSTENIDWLAKSSNDLGLIHYKQKEFESALSFYKESLKFKEIIGNKYYIGTTLNNLGLLNKDIGDYEKSVYYYEQALDSFTAYTQEQDFDIRVHTNISHLYEDLAIISSSLKDTEKNDYYSNKIIETFSMKLSEEEKLRAFKNLAIARLEHNEVVKAEFFLEQVTSNSPKDASYFDEIFYIKARIAYKKNELEQSKRHAKDAIQLAKLSRNDNLLSKIHKTLYEIAQVESNTPSMLDNLKKHYFYNEEVLSKRYQSDLGIINEKIEKERYFRQAAEEKLINESQRKEIKSLTLILFSVILVIIFASLAIGLFISKKRKEHQELLDSIASHKEKLFLLEADKIDTKAHSENSDDDFRIMLVDLMLDATALWEKATNSNMIELAEKSGIWKISIDSGRLRTRSLDKYLSLQKLPLNPRWKNVVRTGHYILSECNLTANERDKFNKKLEDLMFAVKERSMRSLSPE